MEHLIDKRVEIINLIKINLSSLSYTDIEKLNEELVKQFIFKDYQSTNEIKEFSTVKDMKLQNLPDLHGFLCSL